jgi:hypothetical protein
VGASVALRVRVAWKSLMTGSAILYVDMRRERMSGRTRCSEGVDGCKQVGNEKCATRPVAETRTPVAALEVRIDRLQAVRTDLHSDILPQTS